MHKNINTSYTWHSLQILASKVWNLKSPNDCLVIINEVLALNLNWTRASAISIFHCFVTPAGREHRFYKLTRSCSGFHFGNVLRLYLVQLTRANSVVSPILYTNSTSNLLCVRRYHWLFFRLPTFWTHILAQAPNFGKFRTSLTGLVFTFIIRWTS